MHNSQMWKLALAKDRSVVASLLQLFSHVICYFLVSSHMHVCVCVWVCDFNLLTRRLSVVFFFFFRIVQPIAAIKKPSGRQEKYKLMLYTFRLWTHSVNRRTALLFFVRLLGTTWTAIAVAISMWCATPERCQFRKIIFVYYLLCATAPTTTSMAARAREMKEATDPCAWFDQNAHAQHHTTRIGCWFFKCFSSRCARCIHETVKYYTVSEPTNVSSAQIYTWIQSVQCACRSSAFSKNKCKKEMNEWESAWKSEKKETARN